MSIVRATSPISSAEDKTSVTKHWSDGKPLVGTRNEIVEEISIRLEMECKKNYTDKLPTDQNLIIGFHCKSLPSMTITDYLKRLALHITVSSDTLKGMVGIFKRCPLEFNHLTAHQLVLTSLFLAHIQMRDKPISIKWFAKVGGTTKHKLERLVRRLLRNLKKPEAEKPIEVEASELMTVRAIQHPLSIKSTFHITSESVPKIILPHSRLKRLIEQRQEQIQLEAQVATHIDLLPESKVANPNGLFVTAKVEVVVTEHEKETNRCSI